MDFDRVKSTIYTMLLLLTCNSCDDNPTRPPDPLMPLFPLTIGNAWHYTRGYMDSVYSDTTFNGHTWYVTSALAFPVYPAGFLMRVDESERYWVRVNDREVVALDPAWPIQEERVLDLGPTAADSGRFTVEIHSKHLTQVVLGDTIQDCFVVKFNDRQVFDSMSTLVLARGIGTVRIQFDWALLLLEAYQVN